jgi:hypothetical protein
MIFDKINDLEKELKSRFEVDFILERSVREFHYETSMEVCNVNLKKLFHTVYSEHSGFSIIWKQDSQTFGEIQVPRIIYSFSNVYQERYIQVYDEFGEEFKSFARQFYPFDIYEESLDAVKLAVVKIIDEEHLEIWMWNNAGPKYKLKFNSIEEYLEAGIKCKFIVNWQYFYLDTDALDFNDPFTKEWVANSYLEATEDMNYALTSMKEHFPEEDWSYQEGEMERVKLLEKR